MDNSNNNFDNNMDAANFCNDYFISIGNKLASKIQPPINMINHNMHLCDSVFLNPVTKNEVINCISTLKSNSSPGMNKIPSKLVKERHIYILKPLFHIINLIFTTGIIPEQFKTSM